MMGITSPYAGQLLPPELRSDARAHAEFFDALYAPAVGTPGVYCEIRPMPTWNEKPEKNQKADPMRQWIPLTEEGAGARVQHAVATIDRVVMRRWSKSDGKAGQTFFAVNPRRLGGGLKDDCIGYVAVYADLEIRKLELDVGATLAELAALPMPASALVWSGNGLHAYWLFDRLIDLVDRDRVERLVRGVYRAFKHLGADPKVYDASRVLRPPGTANRKLDRPGKPVLLLSLNPDRRYRLRDLERQYPGPIPEDTFRVPVTEPIGRANLPEFEVRGSRHDSLRNHLAWCRRVGADDSTIHARAQELQHHLERPGTTGQVEAERMAQWVNRTIAPGERRVRRRRVGGVR